MHQQRPKRGDTEEDLLKLQEEFFRSGNAKQNASIKSPDKRKHEEKKDNSSRDVVKMEGIKSSKLPATSDPTPPKKTKVVSWKNTAPSYADDKDVEEMMERKDTGLAAVLTTIIERDTRNQMVAAPALSRQAFPSVLQNESIAMPTPSQPTSSGGQRKKKSLFAQHVEAKTAKEFGVDTSAATNTRKPSLFAAQKVQGGTNSEGPLIIDGKGLSATNNHSEAQIIHEENLDRLKSMSEAEILEEQQRLIQSIDPSVLSFLKKTRQDKEGEGAKSRTDNDSSSPSFSVLKARKTKQAEKKEVELSLPFEPEKSWLNMDVVEKDKMEWMTDMPSPSSVSSQTGKAARFDFDGNLLAVDVDIPVHEGLHHHGEEPERAGYTLQELFILGRSSNLQQRILSLHTLAKILRKAKSGELSEKTEGPLLPVLLDGGLVLLLRWALDDSAESVVFAAVDALNALLWNPLDEDAVDSNWPMFLGHMGIALTPSLTLEKWAEPPEMDEENKEEESDGDMMKRDVIEALVKRTRLLTRIHFILDSMRPQALVVVQLMAILCRVAQHSLTISYEIVRYPGLMDKIVKEFLPTAWSVQDVSVPISDVYGLPVPSALRLMRCLSQNGRNIASSLVSKYSLPAVLLRYLAMNARNLHLPVLEASNLQREAIALWTVLVSYNLSTQTFFDLYEVIIQRIGTVGANWDSPQPQLDCDTPADKARLVCVLEKVLTSVQGSKSENESIAYGMPVNWSHVINLYQPIKLFVTDALKTIGSSYPIQKQELTLLASCLNFLASFYDMENKQSGVDTIHRLEELEGLCTDCLVPFLASYGVALMREQLCLFSNVLASSWRESPEITPSLPSLKVSWHSRSTDTGDAEVELNIPCLRHHCPIAFLVSVYRLVLAACRRHKALLPQLLPALVDNPDTLMYLKKVCLSPASLLGSSLWTRQENLLQYYWLKACSLKPCQDMSLAHRVSLHLLTRLSKGDEFIVHDLMSSVIFSPLFIVEGQERHDVAVEAISSLSLSESLYLKSATQEDIEMSKGRLVKEAHNAVATIRGHFLLALSGMEREVTESRSLYCGHPQGISSQMRSCDGESLMPRDWMYLPLIHVYNKATQLNSTPGSEITSKDVVMVTSVLQWVYLLEIWRRKEVDKVSLATRLSRVMCAFIAGNDMFLERGVQKYLAGIFREMTNPKHLGHLDLEESIPGISSFYDLYQEFLEHYESVSFSDPVFGLYVLLPLQQKHSSLIRKAVWGERRKILRTLRVTLQQMLLPVESFLYPEETDLELLRLYAQALVSGTIQAAWSPVLYLVAVHHLNRFLFISHDDGNISMRERLWTLVAAHYKKHLKIVYYKNFNISLQDGMECYDVLPSNRQAILDSHWKGQ